MIYWLFSLKLISASSPSLPPSTPHLVRHVVSRELLQHLVGELLHGALTRFPTPTATVLGLDADDGAQGLVGQVGLVGDVSIGMEAKHLQRMLGQCLR